MFLAFELQNLCLLLKVRFGIWVDIDFFFFFNLCSWERLRTQKGLREQKLTSQLGCEGWRMTVQPVDQRTARQDPWVSFWCREGGCWQLEMSGNSLGLRHQVITGDHTFPMTWYPTINLYPLCTPPPKPDASQEGEINDRFLHSIHCDKVFTICRTEAQGRNEVQLCMRAC